MQLDDRSDVCTHRVSLEMNYFQIDHFPLYKQGPTDQTQSIFYTSLHMARPQSNKL